MKMQKGDIFEINLEDGNVAYAQSLTEPEFAFFEVSPEASSARPLFRIWVHKSAVKGWVKIGNEILPPELEAEMPRFKQDPINGSLSIYKDGAEKPATLEEINGLERAAVWEGAHINDRLSDYFSGKETSG